MIASGESALHLGASPANIRRDIFYSWYNTEAWRRRLLEAQPTEVRDAVAGYAAGYNRYLCEAEALDPACAGEPWVRPIDELDLSAVYNKGNLRGGLANFVPPIVLASPPGTASAGLEARGRRLAFDPSRINVTRGGSNAHALGSEVTENGRAMLYGNPHEPWGATVQRFYEVHLTIPGELDVMGVAQQGQPFVNIGFNEDVAWSHTVSTAKRFSLYQLRLVDGDSLSYVYRTAEGELDRRPIQREPVTIDLPGGATYTGSIYTSHYGPMLAADLVSDSLPPWGAGNIAFTIRDAASENPRGLAQ